MDWREDYKRKLVAAEEAVKVVKSGDLVYIPIYPHPNSLVRALVGRRGELAGVEVHCDAPAFDPGWFQPGWDDSFSVVVEQILGDVGRDALDCGIIDYIPMIFSNQFKAYKSDGGDGRAIDVFMVVTSPPDENGYCSFGGHLWNKRDLMKRSKVVIAEQDNSCIRTYGDNYAHVSDFDYFVERTALSLSPSEVGSLVESVSDADARTELEALVPHMAPEEQSEFVPRLVGLTAAQIRRFGVYQCWLEPPDEAKRIGQYVTELVGDGATLQIGTGMPGRVLARLGVFDDKRDLGWHSEMGTPGVIGLIERGVITGARKTLHPCVAVFGALLGATPAEMRYAHYNPLIQQLDVAYVANVRTVARHDNMISMNNALSVDFSGQINAETVFGGRLMSGTGGQLDFQMGAVLSKGGRAITLLQSTAHQGAVSRIVPRLEEGAVVTVPRTFADTIVTEYGVARLLGKSIRERARELINVAHPDFRDELTKAAEKLLYP